MNVNQVDSLVEQFEQMVTQLASYPTMFFLLSDVNKIKRQLTSISKDIEKEYGYYSFRINFLMNSLFDNVNGNYYACPYIFGQMVEILYSLKNISKLDCWSLIHPKIVAVSKQLYLDGHYANAAEDAFIEINDRVKTLFHILRPQDKVPDGDTAMNMVFSPNNPIIMFCDNSTETGKNIQKGFMQMLSGSISALRNPKAHANISLSSDDAMRRLMFASMLMFKIDEAVAYSSIQE